MDEFVQAKAVVIGQNEDEVVQQLNQFSENEQEAEISVAHANAIMQKNTGSLAKHIQVLNQYL